MSAPCFAFRCVRPNEFGQYLELADRFFGTKSGGPEMVRSIYAKTPDSFSLLLRLDAGGETAVGIMALVPITLETAKSLDRENITGAGFTPDNVLAANQSCGFYYLGALGGLGSRAKAFMLNKLKHAIVELRARNALLLYARPINDAGLRTVMKLGFRRVSQAHESAVDRIHCLMLSPPQSPASSHK